MKAIIRKVRFNIGDRVCWTRAVADPTKITVAGVVLAVIPSDSGLDDFTMYDVQFEFGTFTLYGTQMKPMPDNTGPMSWGERTPAPEKQ
jgi:hypothetical protein